MNLAARRAVPWFVLLAIVVVALGVLVARSSPDATPAARASRLAHQIACPVCTGESVADSNSPESRAIRADIRDRIAKGQTDARIKQAYVDAYTRRILLTPEGSGLGIIAWGLPVLVLVVGFGGIVLALRRWSRQPRLAATTDDEAIVARARDER